MVSLIIPIHNAENYLIDLINSIILQTYSDYELILVNDGSTDSSLEICNKFASKDSRIIVVNQKNCGASAARNAGIRIASRELLTFIDADDKITNNYIEELIADYKKWDSPDFLIQGMIQKWSTKSKMYVLKDGKFNLANGDIESFFSNVKLNDFSGPYCKLYKNKIIKDNKIEFSSQIIYAEDLDFILNYLKCCSTIASSSKTNYFYIMHNDSVSTRLYNYGQECSGLKRLFSSYNELIKKYDSLFLKQMMQESISAYFWRLIYTNYKNGYCTSERIENFKLIGSQELIYFKSNYIPTTFFTRLVKFFLYHKYFRVLDKILEYRLK